MNRQQGVALISVLIIVALITTSVGLMLKRQNTTTKDFKIINNQTEALQYLFSFEVFAQELLNNDDNKKTDWYGEKNDPNDPYYWSKEILFPLDNGIFKGKILDLQAGLNINSAFEYDKRGGQIKEKVSPDFSGCFNRLNLALDSNVTIDNIINYLNSERLQKVSHPSDLKKIPYIEFTDYKKIRNFLFTLDNKNVPINGNTAEPQMLECLHPSLVGSKNAIDNIVGGRPYKNFGELQAKLAELTPLEKKDIKQEFVDVKSNYFVFNGQIIIDKLTLNFISIIQRDSSKIMHRSYYINNN